jgi:drug/metabolite transporter (DMT)-like permease
LLPSGALGALLCYGQAGNRPFPAALRGRFGIRVSALILFRQSLRMKTAWWAMFAIAAFGGAIQSGLIFAGLNRQPETGQESSLRTTTFHVWVAVFVLAIGGYVVAYSIWYGLMQRYRVDQVTPFALLMPLVGVLAGAIILGEHLSLWIPSTVDDPGGTAPAKRAGETFVPSLKIKVVASVPGCSKSQFNSSGCFGRSKYEMSRTHR